tara:strand:- start:413 stop:1243 length:831 start_codon:yes stop_codon:yes gene_type:complete
MIDPCIWDSEQAMELSPRCFKLFVYLISNADDDGRLPLNPVLIASRAFPLDEEITGRIVLEDLNFMKGSGLIVVYKDDVRALISHPNWKRWQTINRPTPSSLPAPGEDSVIPHGALIEDSLKTHGSLTPKLSKEKLSKEKLNGGKMSDPAKTPAVSPPQKDPELFKAIEDSFLSKQKGERFTDYGKERKSIERLIKKVKARDPEDPEAFAKKLLEAFYNLKEHGNGFWADQPFLPSTLNASGIFDRVLVSMDKEEAVSNTDWVTELAKPQEERDEF